MRPTFARISRPTATNVAIVAVVAVFSFWLNYRLAVPAGFDVHLLVGAIPAFLVLRYLGVWQGVVVATVAGSATYSLWGHPWAAAVLMGEMVFVAGLEGWKKWDILSADTIYWLLIGAPAVALSYGLLLHMEGPQLLQVVLKQAFNGIAAASVASLILTLIQTFVSRVEADARPARSFGAILIEMIVPFSALPALLFFTTASNIYEQDAMRSVVRSVVGETKDLVTMLSSWKRQEIERWRSVGFLLLTSGDINMDTTASALDQTSDLGLTSIAVADADGVIKFAWPRQIAFGEVAVLDQGQIEGALRANAGTVSGLQVDPVNGDEYVEMTATLAVGSAVHGFISLRFDAIKLGGLISSRAAALLEDRFQYEISDGTGKLIVSRTAQASGRSRVVPVDVDLADDDRHAISRIEVHFPAQGGLSLMQRWKNSFIVVSSDWIAAGHNWRVIVKGSPQQAVLRLVGTMNLLLALCVAVLVVATIAAQMLTRHLRKPLAILVDELVKVPHPALLTARKAHSMVKEFDDVQVQIHQLNAALIDERRRSVRFEFRLQHLVRNAPVAIYNLVCCPDKTFRTSFMSENIEKLCGFKAEEMRSFGFRHSRIHPADVESFGRALSDLTQIGACSVQYRFRAADGGYLWFREDAQLLPNSVAQSSEAVGALCDITDQKQAELNVLQSSKLITLGEMSSSIAHELNQPLNVIAMASENIKTRIAAPAADASVLPYVTQKLDRIVSQVNRAAGIINHMRMFSRVPDHATEPVAIAAAVDGALMLIGSQLRLADIQVIRKIESDLPDIISHQQQVEQILVNLILNARDAITSIGLRGEGAPATRGIITISAHAAEADWVMVEVSDNGGGIPDSILGLLFDPFFTTKPPGKGTGLGLSICRRIVIDLGGTLVVRNSDEGAVFSFRLPTTTKKDAAECATGFENPTVKLANRA